MRSASRWRTAAWRSRGPAAQLRFPARFQLVAAMNPCPCGFAGTPARPARARPASPDRYAARVCGPLLDRIDLWVAMPRVPPALLGGRATRGQRGRRPRASRRPATARPRASGRLNARVAGRALRAICGLDRAAEARVVELAEAAELSARAAERLLRVARTIADLAGAERVDAAALEEAARYRDPSLSVSRRGAA